MKALALTALLLAHVAGACAAVDVNRASEAELDSVKGLGPATTRRILTERAQRPFTDWQDLLARVKGLGSGNAARHSAGGLRVNGLAYPAPDPSDKNRP